MGLQHIITEEEKNQKMEELRVELESQNRHSAWYNQFVLPLEETHKGQFASVCEHGIVKIGSESEAYPKESDAKCGCKEIYITPIPAVYNNE